MIKRKALALALVQGILAGAIAVTAAGGQVSGVSPARKETTVRNLTKEMVRYSIRQLIRDNQPTVRYLKPNALDRWPCETPLDITFERQGQQIDYRLECGLPYTFRYDADDNLELYSGSHGLFGVADLAPFVPTPMVVVDKMLELAGVGKDDVLFDLGCGDGRIVITAARKFGTRGIGIDIDPQRIEESIRAAREAGVEPLVEFRLQDIMKSDIRKATAVTIYLLPESNALLQPILEAQLRPGTPVVSHNYSIPGWEEKEVDYVTLQDGTGQEHTIFVYKR
ncbi:MAG: methyltransferase domain-containing protein [Candidatus Aminicenantales bacterium]